MTNPHSDRRRPSRWNQTPVPARVAERAFLRHEVSANGCWISKYSTASHGYAQIGWQDNGSRSVVLAHRAAWTHVNGQVPVGMTLDHLCKERRCVNPAHLRILSNFENSRRNQGDDWPLGECRNGHVNAQYVPDKRRSKSGRVYIGYRCIECRRDYQRRHRARKALRGLGLAA